MHEHKKKIGMFPGRRASVIETAIDERPKIPSADGTLNAHFSTQAACKQLRYEYRQPDHENAIIGI